MDRSISGRDSPTTHRPGCSAPSSADTAAASVAFRLVDSIAVHHLQLAHRQRLEHLEQDALVAIQRRDRHLPNVLACIDDRLLDVCGRDSVALLVDREPRGVPE